MESSLRKIGRGNECHAVTIGTLTIYFSYKTAIGFKGDGTGLFRTNAWGPTTGRHLRASKEDAGYYSDEPPACESPEVFAECLALAMRGKYKGPQTLYATIRKRARINKAGERAHAAAVKRIHKAAEQHPDDPRGPRPLDWTPDTASGTKANPFDCRPPTDTE